MAKLYRSIAVFALNLKIRSIDMRRFLIITGILLPVFFLSACDNGIVTNNERPVLEFKSDLDINSEKVRLSASIVRTAAGTVQMDVVSPESLNGLQIKHGESENFITKNGLTYKTDSLILPESSDIAAVIEALEYMADNPDEAPFYKDSEEMAFIGKINSGKFELRANRKSGLITVMKIGEKADIKFSNQEKL